MFRLKGAELEHGHCLDPDKPTELQATRLPEERVAELWRKLERIGC